MSAYTTIRITKTAAIKYLLSQIMGATDARLAVLMDEFLAERLYNVEIAADGDRDADDDLIA